MKRRGVLRVAASYAVIAWLLLQIGDVVLDPFDIGDAAMRVLLMVVALGFPVALALAWFFELTPQGVELDHEAPGAPRPVVGGVRRYADIIIIGVLVVIVAVLLARQGGLIDESPEEHVVAVLPFANLSAEAENAYFGEGLADTLIQKLGQLDELVVLASQSTFQFSGRDLDLSVVGGKLGATTIMTGSVQRSTNTLRVNARLVDVASGRQLWSESYDRTLADVFAVQDDIAASVTEALQVVLAPEAVKRLATPPTDSLSAYDAYLLGISRLARREGESNIAALGFFEQALQADPGYALAQVGLVESYYLMAFWPGDHGWAHTHEAAARAAEAAKALAPDLGEAWLARAMVGVQDRAFLETPTLTDEEIIAAFRRAIELSPNHALAHKYFSNFLDQVGNTDSEYRRQLLMKASRLDPRSGIIKVNIGEGFVAEGDYEQAEIWFRQSIDTVDPYFAVGIIGLVNLHERKTNRLDEAARWATNWFDAYPDERRAFRTSIWTLLDLGALDLARAKDERFTPPLNDGSPYNMPRYTKLLGGILLERATGSLEGALQMTERMSREFWAADPEWPSLQHWGEYSWYSTALAMRDIANGDVAVALQRQLTAYPDPFEDLDTSGIDVLHPPVVTAALYKLNGETEKARKLLEDYLAFVRASDVLHWDNGHGWTPFVILAMLGETEAALDELEAVVDRGFLHEWWALKDGAFDTDYAAVLAHPRFQALYARITARVDALREAYIARPELPEGSIP